MTRREYLEMLRRNRLGDEYGNIMPNHPLPILEEREFVPEEYERFVPYRGRDGRRLRFPDDMIPSSTPEEGLDYGRPYNSLRRRSYPEHRRTMEFRYGRDDVKPYRLDDGVFRPSDPRYRNIRLEPMTDLDCEDVGF